MDRPDDPDELYRYRLPDVPATRPIFQGDVFRDIEIPGINDGAGLALVLTHPCSMRGAGSHLTDRLLMARVTLVEDPGPAWRTYRVMPLPNLLPEPADAMWFCSFDEIGIVQTDSLAFDRRVACLDDYGITILQQRHIHFFTRYEAETEVLYEASGAVLGEAELLEDWLEKATAASPPDDLAAAIFREEEEFDSYFSQHRGAFRDQGRRSGIRRQVRVEIESRHP